MQAKYTHPCPVNHSVQSLSHVWLFATPWTAARQACLSITNSWSLLRGMPVESVMPSNHLSVPRLYPLHWLLPVCISFHLAFYASVSGASVIIEVILSILSHPFLIFLLFQFYLDLLALEYYSLCIYLFFSSVIFSFISQFITFIVTICFFFGRWPLCYYYFCQFSMSFPHHRPVNHRLYYHVYGKVPRDTLKITHLPL